MKIIVICPYFGKFPLYFDLFLESCRYNPEILFLIFTDQGYESRLPDNVKIATCSFEHIRALIQGKLSLDERKSRILSPYKLCDYRPAYGKIFEGYLREADFWGFCDIDLIFGKIFNILSMERFRESERVLTQGHLTFYKNTERMNTMFLKEIEKGINFQRAISFKEPAFFDEIFMPAICKANKVIQYGENRFADILPQYANLLIASSCTVKNKAKQQFYWQKGKLFVQSENSMSELMYIHLQKRMLTPYYNEADLRKEERIYFTPQGIFPARLYTREAETGNDAHVKAYRKKRWSSLSLRKVWVKLKVIRFKNQYL